MNDQLRLDSPRLMLRGFTPLNSVCPVKSSHSLISPISQIYEQSMLEAQPHKFPPVVHYGCPTHCDQLVKKQEYFIANMRSQKENTERDFNMLFQHMIFRKP